MDTTKLTAYIEEKSEKHTATRIVKALVADGFEVLSSSDVRRVYLKGYDIILKVQRSMVPPYCENLIEHRISDTVAATPLATKFVPVLASTRDHRIIAMPYHDTLSAEEGRTESYKTFERQMASSPMDLYLTRPDSTVVGTGAQLHYEYCKTLPQCVSVLLNRN